MAHFLECYQTLKSFLHLFLAARQKTKKTQSNTTTKLPPLCLLRLSRHFFSGACNYSTLFCVLHNFFTPAPSRLSTSPKPALQIKSEQSAISDIACHPAPVRAMAGIIPPLWH